MTLKWLAGGPVDASDYDHYEHEHRRMFGHTPVIDITGKRRCIHAYCLHLEAAMSRPGVEIALTFRPMDIDRDELLTMDEEEINPRFRQ